MLSQRLEVEVRENFWFVYLGFVPYANVISGTVRFTQGSVDVVISIAARIFSRSPFFETTAGMGLLNMARGAVEAGPLIYLTAFHPQMKFGFVYLILSVHSLTLLTFELIRSSNTVHKIHHYFHIPS